MTLCYPHREQVRQQRLSPFCRLCRAFQSFNVAMELGAGSVVRRHFVASQRVVAGKQDFKPSDACASRVSTAGRLCCDCNVRLPTGLTRSIRLLSHSRQRVGRFKRTQGWVVLDLLIRVHARDEAFGVKVGVASVLCLGPKSTHTGRRERADRNESLDYLKFSYGNFE